jgi:hypothetical protein
MLTDLNVQSTFQHVPSLIVTTMKMPRRDEPRRAWWTAWVPPLGDHKCIVDRADDLSGKQRRCIW